MSSLGYALYNENDESSLDAKRHARNKTIKKKFPSDNEQQVKRVLDTIKGGDKEERATLHDGADFYFEEKGNTDEGGDVTDGMADFNPMSNPVLTTVKGESGGSQNVGVGNHMPNVGTRMPINTVKPPGYSAAAFTEPDNGGANMPTPFDMTLKPRITPLNSAGSVAEGTEPFSNTMPNTYSKDYFQQYVPYYNQMSQSNGNKDDLLEKLNYMIHLLEEQQEEKTGHVLEELVLYSFLGIFIIFIVDSFARAGKYIR